jgi:hypothetical protein
MTAPKLADSVIAFINPIFKLMELLFPDFYCLRDFTILHTSPQNWKLKDKDVAKPFSPTSLIFGPRKAQ